MGGGNFISCPNQTLFLGDSINVENQNGAVAYQWFPDSVLSSSAVKNPYITTDFNRHFKLKVTDDSGCVDSIFVGVVMQPGYTQFTDGIYEDWENRYGGQDTAFKLIGEVYQNNHQTFVATTYQADSFNTKPLLLVYDTLGKLKTSLLLNTENNYSYKVVDMQIDQRNGNVYLIANTITSEVKSISTFKLGYNEEAESYEKKWERLFSTEITTIPYDLDLRQIVEDESMHIVVVGKIWNEHSLFDRLTLIYTQSGSLIDSITSKNTSNDANFNIKFDEGSNIYVNGYESQNDTSNIIVEKLSYNETITSVWSTFYNYKSGNDYPTGIELLGEDVYTSANVADTGNPSIMLLKHAQSNGSLQWAAKYNAGEELADESHGLLINNENIFVFGYTELESNNKDMVLLKYNTSGALQWGRTFEALGQQNDEILNAQLVNDTNILCVGYGQGCGTKKDMQLLYIQNNGNIIWENRFDGLNYGEDVGQFIHLDTDLNGNNYLVFSGWASGDYNYIATNRLGLYTPPEPEYNYNTQLHMLAVGLTDVANNPTVKNIITDTSHYYFDGIHYIYLQELIDRAIALEIDVLDSMNTKIHAVYETTLSNDTVTSFLNQLTFELDSGGMDTARVILQIPNYLLFEPNGFEEDFKLSYYTAQQTFQLNSVNYQNTDLLNNRQLAQPPPKLTVATNKEFLADEIMWNGLEIREPVYYKCLPALSNCNDCGTLNNQTFLNTGGSTPTYGNTGTEEVYISTHLNANGILGQNGSDNCIDYRYLYQANLSAAKSLNYQPYERILGGITHSHMKKVKYSMSKTNDIAQIDKRFNSQTICDLFTGFNTMDEIKANRLQLSSGVIYTLTRKKSFQKPLYLIVPTYFGLTYINDPDIFYFFSTSSQNCSNPLTYDEGYKYSSADVLGTFSDNFNTPDYNFIASTDFSKISSFIYKNKIIINFSAQSGSKGNLVEFLATNNEPGCVPPSTYSAKYSFTVNPRNEFEIQKSVLSSPLDEFEIHAEVNFKNGESINRCKTLILNQNQSSFSTINIAFFGNLLDYNNSIDNYLIEIYKQ